MVDAAMFSRLCFVYYVNHSCNSFHSFSEYIFFYVMSLPFFIRSVYGGKCVVVCGSCRMKTYWSWSNTLAVCTYILFIALFSIKMVRTLCKARTKWEEKYWAGSYINITSSSSNNYNIHALEVSKHEGWIMNMNKIERIHLGYKYY